MARNARRRCSGSAIAEFGPALWFFLIIIILPLLDLFSFAVGVGVVMFLSNWGAKLAAPCATYGEAVQSLDKTVDATATFRGFAVMKPNGPTGKPYTLVVVVTPTAGGTPKTFTTPGSIPNQPPPDASQPDVPEYNTINSIYQYQVTAQYNIMPLINFGQMPFLNNVPALGQPVPVQFTTVATVEHPEGLNQ